MLCRIPRHSTALELACQSTIHCLPRVKARCGADQPLDAGGQRRVLVIPDRSRPKAVRLVMGLVRDTLPRRAQ